MRYFIAIWDKRCSSRTKNNAVKFLFATLYFASAGNDLFMFVIYSKRSFGFMYPTFLLFLLAHKKFTFLKVNLCSFKLNSVKLNAVMGTSRVFSQLEQNNHLTLIQSPERKLATTMRWNPFWNIYHKKFMKSLVKMSVYH